MVSIDAVVAGKLGLASHQNAVPLLRGLAVTHDGPDALDNLTLEFKPGLPFAAPKTWRIQRLDGTSSVTLTDRDIELKEGYLSSLEESMQATVRLSLHAGVEVLAEQQFAIELLARNEWGGAGSMPELLAAFCTPNDPAIDRLLKVASDTLAKEGQPAGIDGYAAGSRQRVWMLTSAIWSAVCGRHISYVLPPASFELQGQKIRTPTQVLDSQVGTCLDTALLFAAALEQAGLNPLVVLTKGHAFTGVWLQPQQFSQVLTDDASALRKHIELRELLVFETTLATHTPAPAFSAAIDAGKAQLTDDEFVAAIDMRRARMQRLRPLAMATRIADQPPDTPLLVPGEALELAPELPGFDVEVEEAPATTPAGKLQQWQRKLLDLTTRNRLLHLPDRAKAVHLVCPDPGALEDLLASNRSVRIIPMPALDAGGRDGEIYQKRHRENLEEAFASQALTRGEVPSPMDAAHLDASLVDLYRKARTELEEGGSNTLFLAVGFLRWKKAANDPRSYRAPLILLPVKLERHSVLSGVKMSMLDDEPRFNLTLLELLRHDFRLDVRGLDGSLPTDASGIDVAGIWNVVRRAVLDLPGFEVVTDVVLGTFSFAKYLMWRDLVDRADELMQNDVVRQLLEPKHDGTRPVANTDWINVSELDEKVRPGDLFVPLPADSSQLAAVVASASGHSFVLDGPPGTGKSQTIANMIAHNLALGRRVLFVAEKMAALDVVKRRLDEKGVGAFCLELHSSKSTKLHVLQQLDRAWMARGTLSASEWQAEADRISSRREHLNGVVAALHRRWPNGWSVYDAIGRAVRDATAQTPRLEWPAPAEHDQAVMDRLRHVARRLELNRVVLERAGSRLASLRFTDWSNAWQEEVVDAAGKLLSAATACDADCARLLHVTGLSPEPAGVAIADKVLAFAGGLPDAQGVDLRFAFAPAAQTTQKVAQRAIVLLRECEALRKRLSQPCRVEAVGQLDVAGFRKDWVTASGRFWILATHAKKKVALRLATAAGMANPPDVDADLPRLATLQSLIRQLDALRPELNQVPGWDGVRSNTARMTQAIRLAKGFRESLIALAVSPKQLVRLKREAQRLLVERNESLAPKGAVASALATLRASRTALSAAMARFSDAIRQPSDSVDALPALLAMARAVVDDQQQLSAWCAWCRVRAEACACGLQPLVEAMEQGAVPGRAADEVFEAGYARWFAGKAIDAEPLLRNFVPREQQDEIDAYAAAVDRLAAMAPEYIHAKLAAKVPDKRDAGTRDGFSVLKRELQKQRRHKPVRQLAAEMGDAFAALAPCMLMSPLSIAQYLPADHALFDLVIFDEASQIAPWDAVGAMARGKQVVIAGDPRQMPPTSFFNRQAGDEDDDTGNDMESVLDECLGSGIPQHSLTWHYRSRHESLITFSNRNYYDNRLITFPAADTRPSAVGWRRVDGIYARGSGRHNPIEAKAVVAEVVARLTDPVFVASGRTIGVIVLNVDQQQLIEDLLDQARQQHPAIEPYFKAELAEPVVVKNLETMQGDERDLILLGIGFGPTEPGARSMSMNFGPLNRDGGWRRLNVAATRARCEMLVFTSFDPSMIDLNRTSARAVHDLRHFIEFAKSGPQALAAAVRGSVGGHESPFEQFVADGLRSRGWQVHSQIGVSCFRIDLGIVHPDRPGDYLVGVECDGASYHSAATARDRDKVRSAILQGLGWRLLRVWSTAWWADSKGALDRLHAAIEQLLSTSRATPEPVAARGADAAPAIGHTEPEAHDDQVVDSPVAHASAAPTPVATAPATAGAPAPAAGYYRCTDFSSLQSLIRPDAFHDAAYDDVLTTLIGHVVACEAPILDRVLVDRVARAHGFKRSGRLIRERVLDLAERTCHLQADIGGTGSCFVWPSDASAQCWKGYRLPAAGDDSRAIEEIAAEELRAAAADVHGGDVPLEVSRLLGVRRLSAQARARVEAALQGSD